MDASFALNGFQHDCTGFVVNFCLDSVHVPDANYLKEVKALCEQHDALLIIDEIQAGMGRTGKFFGYEHFGIQPDIVTLAKGLAGGVPIGAFLSTKKLANTFHAGDHGSTFGGNPLACAAANAVLTAIKAENLMDNAATVGDYLIAQLKTLQQSFPTLITEVRGKGLIVGMELTKPGRDIVNDCLSKGLIINCTAGNVLRFVPPLIITKDNVDTLITILKEVLPAYAN